MARGAESADAMPAEKIEPGEAENPELQGRLLVDPKEVLQIAQATERRNPWADTDPKAYLERRVQPEKLDHKQLSSLANAQAAKLSEGIMDAFKKADFKSTVSQIINSYQELDGKHYYYPQALDRTLGKQLQGEGIVIERSDQRHDVTLSRPGNQYALRISTASGKVTMIDQFNGDEIVNSGSKEKLFASIVKPDTSKPGYMNDLLRTLSSTHGSVEELSAIMQTAYQHGYELDGKQLIGNEAVVKLVEATNKKISREGRNFQISPAGTFFDDTKERVWDVKFENREISGSRTFYIKEDPAIEGKTGDTRPPMSVLSTLYHFNEELEKSGGPERFDTVTRELAKSLELAYKQTKGSAADKLQALVSKGIEINNKWRVGFGIGASGIKEAQSGKGPAEINIQLLQLDAAGKQRPIGNPLKLNLGSEHSAEVHKEAEPAKVEKETYKLPKESPQELADELNDLWRQGIGKDGTSQDYAAVFEKVSSRILHSYQTAKGDKFAKMEAAKTAAK